MKVSFDFDGTLDRLSVQKYAEELINSNIEVWITTTRNDYGDNDDLFEIAKYLNIPLTRIKFTNMEWKYKYLKDTDFIFHLDDHFQELKYINKHTKVRGISVFRSSTWKHKCNKLLNK